MDKRIHAVSQMVWALCAASVALCLLGLPLRDDGETMDALNELLGFDRAFDRAVLESGLILHASSQGSVAVKDIATALSGRGMPNVSAATDAQAVSPRVAVTLDTLGVVHALGAKDASVELAMPSASALALSLGWRLSRRQGAERFELRDVALTERGCSDADIKREQTIADARKTALAAHSHAALAQKRQTQAEGLYDLRRKRKASWKIVSKANEDRLEAEAKAAEAQSELVESEGRYAALAKQAENATFAPSSSTGNCLLAKATLIEHPAGKAWTLTLPTPITRRPVSVPRITGADFPVLRATGLWAGVKNLSVKQAIGSVNDRFSWHYRYVELGPIKLGGMTVLQFAPLLLLPLYLVLLRRSRGVGASYNPFDRPPGQDLPRVGLGTGIANLGVLVILPVLGCALCAYSLAVVEQAPIVPLLCALASIALGVRNYSALRDLSELRDAITRSHSHPPPMPSAHPR